MYVTILCANFMFFGYAGRIDEKPNCCRMIEAILKRAIRGERFTLSNLFQFGIHNCKTCSFVYKK